MANIVNDFIPPCTAQRRIIRLPNGVKIEFRGHCPNANLFKYEPIKVKE